MVSAMRVDMCRWRMQNYTGIENTQEINDTFIKHLRDLAYLKFTLSFVFNIFRVVYRTAILQQNNSVICLEHLELK